MLPELIRGLGGRRAVLFTDKGVTKAGVTDQINIIFEQVAGPVQLAGVFDEIVQDAKASIVNQAAQFVKTCNADTLIALGGGSVLDTVKGVKWLLHKGQPDIRNILQDNVLENWPEAGPIPITHIAIPTTAGTGSEISPIAVIFNEQLQLKTNLIHPFISADVAILDPELTVHLPPRITAFTGFDALTHAVEAYFSPKANPMTDAFALHSIRLIIDNLPNAVTRGDHLESRAQMLIASSMAIAAFTLSMAVIPVHNFAHVFGAKFGIPHGLANAVLLPNVMAGLPDLYLPRIQDFVRLLGIAVPSQDAEACLSRFVQFIRDFRKNVGLPDTFAEFKLNGDQLQGLVSRVQTDPAGIAYRIPEQVIVKVIKEVSGLDR
ncbi:Alcohol dehydrogenase, class IV [Lihuaxuella thermophila]|uniref:Alcohol dehydrogenase, class IV n=2 Tax=Lihuaxuella thermophila TaxID=1173111 RepID=A0A1H8GGN0_9BACL|nr:Alcohol dehydrogenase, class IV [Lihuaxuella thermophila]